MNATALRAFGLMLIMVVAAFAAMASGGSDPDDEERNADDVNWLRVTGVVLDGDDPVGGASVYLAPDWELINAEEGYYRQVEKGWAQTGDDGTFRLDALAGSYFLSVYAAGYFSYYEPLEIEEETSLEVELEAIPARDATLRLTVSGPQAFSATLRDAAREWWIASVWGEDGGEVTLAGWAGELELEIYPYYEGYLIHRQTVTLVAGETTALALTLEPYVESGTLTGFARDQHGNGVAQARVSFALPDLGYRASTLTADDGSYSVAVVPGTYSEIQAAAIGHTYAPIELALLVEEDATVTHNLTLTAKAFDYEQQGVVEDYLGQRMANVTVTAWGYLYGWHYSMPLYGYPEAADGSYRDATTGIGSYPGSERIKVAETLTDAEGHFELLLPAGESLELEAVAEGYVAETRWVWTETWKQESHASEDETNSDWERWSKVRFVLYPEPDVALSGTVSLPDGTAVAGAWVSFHRNYQPPAEGKWIAAVWQQKQVEGGCWLLEAENGDHFEVVDTASDVTLERVVGEKVWVRIEQAEMSTACQVGQPVRVLAAGDADATLPGTDDNEWSFSGGWNYRFYGGSASSGDDGGYEMALYSGTYKVTAWYYDYDDVWYFTDDDYDEKGYNTMGQANANGDAAGLFAPPVRAPDRYRFAGEVTLTPGEQVYDIALEKIEDDATLSGTVTLSDGSTAGGSGTASGSNGAGTSGDAGNNLAGSRTFWVTVSGPDYHNQTLVRDGAWSVKLPHGQAYSYYISSNDPLVEAAWGFVEIGAEGSETTVSDELKVTVLDSVLKGTVSFDGRPVGNAWVTVWGVEMGYDRETGDPNTDPDYDWEEEDATMPPGYNDQGDWARGGEGNAGHDQGQGDKSDGSDGAPVSSDDTDDWTEPGRPSYGRSFTRTTYTNADGKFSLEVAGGQLYSVEVSYIGSLDIQDVESYYGAFRHVYVDHDVAVELTLSLEQQWQNRYLDDTWWETAEKAPKALNDAGGDGNGAGWRDTAASDAVADEFPFRVAVTWPPQGTAIPVTITDPDGVPVVGLKIVVFRDGEEYSTAVTDSDGRADVELGDTAGHSYAFEAQAGDQVMAFVAMEQLDPDPESESALPAAGALAALALLGLVAARRRRD